MSSHPLVLKADRPGRAPGGNLAELNSIEHADHLVVDWNCSCCDLEFGRLCPTRDTGHDL